MKWVDEHEVTATLILCFVAFVFAYGFVVASPRARAFLTDDETMSVPLPDAAAADP